MDSSGLLYVFILLASVCIVVPLMARFKLGSVLGYLAAGVIIGPFGLAFLADASHIIHLAEIGVIMMLFLIGLELEPPALWRLRRAIIGLGGLQMILTGAVIFGIALFVGLSWQASLVVAMALPLSSTALVLQLLREKNLLNTSLGETSFAVLLFQDIAVIFILIAMPLLAVNSSEIASGNHLISSLPGWQQALIVAGVIGLLIAGGRYVSHHMFSAIARANSRETFTALSLALIVGITLLMQTIGISPALGAFIAGVVLANSQYRRTLETDIEPFKGLLLGLFFISVGIGFDVRLFIESPGIVLGLVALLIALKFSILYGLGRAFGIAGSQRIGFALVLSQGGEFAFVLFQLAGGMGIVSQQENQFLTLCVALSLATTPLLMAWYNRMIVPRFMSQLPEREYDVIEQKHAIILAGFGRFGQVIGRFLIAQHVPVTVLDKDPDQLDLIRKFGFHGYFGDSTRLDLLRSAGAETASLLVVAVDDVESSLRIVRMAREEFPNLTIFARARNRRHAYELHNLGVHYFKREMFDSSLDMAKEIMVWLGNAEPEMAAKAAQFRKHDEATLRESFSFFTDESALVNFAKTRRAELESILRTDARDH